MDFEWDEDKNASNIQKHGIDFSDAMYIWEGPVYEKPDLRDYNGESRLNAFGMLDDRVLAVAFTWRGDVCRIISARKANNDERRAYYATLSGVAPNP